MAKRTFEDYLEERDDNEYRKISPPTKLFRSNKDIPRDHATTPASTPAPTKKLHSFNVDALLSDENKNHKNLTNEKYHLHQRNSPSVRLIKQEDREDAQIYEQHRYSMYTESRRYSPEYPRYSPEYHRCSPEEISRLSRAKHYNYAGLHPTSSSYWPNLLRHYYLPTTSSQRREFPSNRDVTPLVFPLDAFRHRDSGSADSVGSSCNSSETFLADGSTNRYSIYRKLYKQQPTNENEFKFPNTPHEISPLTNEHVSLMYSNGKQTKFPYDKTDGENVAREKCNCKECRHSIEKSPNDRYIHATPTHIVSHDNQHSSTQKINENNISKNRLSTNESSSRLVSRGKNWRKGQKSTAENKPSIHEEDEGSGAQLSSPSTTTPLQRNRSLANSLERLRVAELNKAYENLRLLVPCYGNENKNLSKIKTLKYAFRYMDHLMHILHEQNNTQHFQLDKDFPKLSRFDPLIKICFDHMFMKNIF